VVTLINFIYVKKTLNYNNHILVRTKYFSKKYIYVKTNKSDPNKIVTS